MCAEINSSLKQRTLKGNDVVWKPIGQNVEVTVMPAKGCKHEYYSLDCEECSNERELMGRLMIMK